MRDKFEALPEIEPLIEFASFSSSLNRYSDESGLGEKGLFFLNGAWLAFQKQQNKIDEALDGIMRAKKCCESTETMCVLNEIQEILK